MDEMGGSPSLNINPEPNLVDENKVGGSYEEETKSRK